LNDYKFLPPTGDLIYPVFTIGFFLVGVVVVVKVLLSLVALLGAKLFHGFIPRSIDDLLTGNRKRRSIDEVDDTPLDQAKLDGLTAVVMAALDSQQWYVKNKSPNLGFLFLVGQKF
jgi:hypothetical protein